MGNIKKRTPNIELRMGAAQAVEQQRCSELIRVNPAIENKKIEGDPPSLKLRRTGEDFGNENSQNKPNLKMQESPDFMGVEWRFWPQKNKPNLTQTKPI